MQESATASYSKSSDPCLICSLPTATLHFQLIICSACSIFYRRSLKLFKTYKCKRTKGRCNLADKLPNKPLCKFCRWQKCLQIGLKNGEKERNKKMEVHEKPLPSDSFYSVFQDVETLLKIQQPPNSNFDLSKCTQQFNDLLTEFLELTKPIGIPCLIKDDEQRLKFVSYFYSKSAQMLQKYSVFAHLPSKEKIQIHTKFWQIFSLLERAYRTCQYFGTNLEDERVIIDYNQFVDNAKVKEYLNDGMNEDGCTFFLMPYIEQSRNTMKHFKRLNPSFFEFAYMCQLGLWMNFDLINLSESTTALAEKIIDQLSKDLHKYYRDEWQMPYYAARQASLFRMVCLTEAFVREKIQLLKAKNIFDFGTNNIPYCQFDYSFFNYVNKNSG